MTWIKWLSFILAALVVVLVALSAYGSRIWAQSTQAPLAQLEVARVPSLPASYDAREIYGLPVPVQRSLRTVLKDGQAITAAASVEHTGTFNMGEVANQWKPFTSRQRVITKRPGFVWDGRVVMMPGLSVHVHDAYVSGVGILHPAIMGPFTLRDLRSTGEVAWLTPVGRKPYWRGTITSLNYEFVK
jgi:hypothetical protein